MAHLLLGVDGLTVGIDDHPQQVGDGVLEGEDGIALERIAGVLPSLLSLGLAGCPFPIGEQLYLPQRDTASEHAANHHPRRGPARLATSLQPP